MEDYRVRYQQWLEDPFIDEATKAELRGITDENEIKERFFKELEFGTGGLRGIIGNGSNRLNRYTVGKASQGLANYIKKEGTQKQGVAIAYDSRFMSPEFAEVAGLIFAANGIPAYVYPSLRPVPMLSFAVRELGCTAGVVLTASHNPPEYNGYKVYWADGAQVVAPRDKGIITEVNAVENFGQIQRMEKAAAVEKKLYNLIGEEVDEAFDRNVQAQLMNPEMIARMGDKLNIVYTPLHGSGNLPVRRNLAKAGFKNVFIVKKQGLKGVTTETGAGQWGTALSMACAYLGLDCNVYMVKVSYEQKPFRREVMRTYGATVTPSPSTTTEIGKKILAEHPGTTGSLGCAISEAVETAVGKEGYRYVLGSVLNQVLLHQSIIGMETKAALDKYGIEPDIIIGCAGGGSNLGGLISPFMGEKLRGEKDYQIIAVEPASCPSLTRGKFAYDFCDTGMVTPLAKMYTLGSGFIPSPNHAGGLRYHGMSPVVSQLYHDGLMEARSIEQTAVFDAAEQFARIEGILPAPESSHAIRVAIDEALKCKETGEEKTIVFGLTGTGYFDMVAYEKFNNGEMSDYIPTDADLEIGFKGLPDVPEK